MVFAFQSLVPSMSRAIHAQAEGALGLLSNPSITRSRVCAPACEGRLPVAKWSPGCRGISGLSCIFG